MSEQKINAHIIYTPFTGVGLHGGFRGDKWFKHRIKIFKDFTLKSLVNQSNMNFIHWISFRPEEKNNPRVEELSRYLSQIDGYKFIFTFDGLMYHDDKFSNYNFRAMTRNFLMMLWDGWRRKQKVNLKQIMKYTWENKNNNLVERTHASLLEVAKFIGIDYEWIYLTRIDSDDMFQREAVELIQAQTPEYKKALVFDKGYILNIKSGEVADWNPPTNPPFHTIIFPGAIFFSPRAHTEYYGRFRSHEDIPECFEAITLDHDKYMVAFQGDHISTAWQADKLRKVKNKLKHGKTEFKGYMYTSGTGENISTHWQSKTKGTPNAMRGKEYADPLLIIKEFGL